MFSLIIWHLAGHGYYINKFRVWVYRIISLTWEANNLKFVFNFNLKYAFAFTSFFYDSLSLFPLTTLALYISNSLGVEVNQQME